MISQIRPTDLQEWLVRRSDTRAVVLDVREPWEVDTAHVQANGFELVYIPMAALPGRITELTKDRPIACLCHLGGRSMQVALYLEQQGFEDVANIAGGIHAWALEWDSNVPVY